MDNEKLKRLYGEENAPAQAERYARLKKLHAQKFGEAQGFRFVSAPGRTEIIGNHTDHNAGRVLAGAIDLDTVAAVSPNDKDVVTLYSEGYQRPFVVALNDLTPRAAERETSLALIRGVAAHMKELGFRIGGFDACVTSTVLKGSGLSSSAAFEVLICAAFDSLYNGFTVDAKLRAKIAQYAENEFFGKPCGLMDQMGSSVGGLVTIDFGGSEPVVEQLPCDFEAHGYAVAIVAVGGEHGNLTNEYAAIPAEMKAVAKLMGKSVLREVDPDAFDKALPDLKGKVCDRALLRAMHFFDENERVGRLVLALRAGDIPAAFREIIASGESSWKLLQNLYVAGSANEEMPLALALSEKMLSGRGAWRIHGGGFAGTILAFVPLAMMETYARTMNAVFGEGAVVRLRFRPEGAAEIAE